MLKTRRVRHTLQLTQAECGLCCTHMILRHHGSRESMTSLRQSFDVGRDGLSIRGMKDALQTRGMPSRAFKARAEVLDRMPAPFIALWEKHHFVVVESVGAKSGVIVDPSAGRQRLDIEELREAYSGIVLLFEPGDQFDPGAFRSRSPWRTPLAHALTMRGYLAIALAISVITYGGTLASPLITEYLVNDAARSGFGGTSFTVLAAVFGVALTYFLMLVLQTVTSTRIVTTLGKRMMTSTFRRLLTLPYQYFSSRSAGELLFRLNGLSMVRDLFGTELVRSVFQLGSIVFVAGYMLWRSVPLSLVALGLLAILCVVLGTTRRRTQDIMQQELSASSKASAIQVEAVASIEGVKLSGTEDDLLDRWEKQYDESLRKFSRRLNTQGRVNGSVTTIQFAGPLLILAYGLYLYGQNQISLGAVIAFQSLSGTFFASAATLFSTYTQFLQVGTFLDRIRDIDEAPVDEWPTHGVTKQIAGRIRLEDVSYRYGLNSEDVLQHIDLDIAPGDKVAIVGRSGSGKSTLARLLCGLYLPTTGTIEIDSIPLRDYDRKNFYSQLAAVPQDVKLQNISIADNIALGHEGATDEQIHRAAVAAQIHDEIAAMPLGYDTVLSELGSNLSGGQQQRVAIARSLVGSPRIVIYDEATSSLDLLNETKVSEHLMSLECTRVIVAHRLSTVIDADRIVVMGGGRILEQGTHAELMSLRGEYRTLFERQADLQNVSADDYL